MKCNKTECLHHKVCQEWVILGNDNYINDSVGYCDLYQPVHKSGKWIRWREEVQRGTHYTENIPHCKCSECGKEYDTFASRFINYCPNCGAKMVESQESEDK